MDGALEPYFVKALNLLHSKAKDSTEQLKAMLDEALRQRASGNINTSKLLGPLIIKKDNIVRDSPVLFRKDDNEKRQFDKLKDEDVPLSKRQRIDSPSPKDDEMLARIKGKLDSPRSSLPSSPTRSPMPSAPASPAVVVPKKNEDSDSLVDADDLALEIMDLHCVVCNGLDVTSGNQLVECQECHDLYHQECHRPAISDNDVNDPRVVWYCNTCNKTMKKTAGKPGSSKPGSNRESPVLGKSPTTPLKRRPDSPASIKLSSNVKSGSSSSSSSSSSGKSGSSAQSAADKRLQIMKKKAATKLNEKRKPGK